jgi:transcription initiation factor TFIIIB Brf1 subunit/transcription initiation factor TFIIB
MNIKDIMNSWVTKFNPSDIELDLAQKRIEICSLCEHKRLFIKNKEWSSVCGKCGCPINTKIFSKEYNSCPEKKWGEIDFKFNELFNYKKNKTII